jgi:hypothetical protein
MSVPKTSMYEYDLAVAAEDEIGFPREVLGMEAVTKAE